jgi:hypothetical protein
VIHFWGENHQNIVEILATVDSTINTLNFIPASEASSNSEIFSGRFSGYFDFFWEVPIRKIEYQVFFSIYHDFFFMGSARKLKHDLLVWLLDELKYTPMTQFMQEQNCNKAMHIVHGLVYYELLTGFGT